MKNQIAETRVPVRLGDQDFELYFNANTMCAFEEATNKNFLSTVASLYTAYKPTLEAMKDGAGVDNDVASLQIIRQVPMTDLSALIWAGLHTYDAQDEPHWPMTLHQVRRLISVADIPRLFLSFLQGQTRNSPTAQEMGESPALSGVPEKTEATDTPAAAPTKPNGKFSESGGERSTELPADAFT